MKRILYSLLLTAFYVLMPMAHAQERQGDYLWGRVTSFASRFSRIPIWHSKLVFPKAGTINYPLVGAVQIGGLGLGAAEQKIAKALKEGGLSSSHR